MRVCGFLEVFVERLKGRFRSHETTQAITVLATMFQAILISHVLYSLVQPEWAHDEKYTVLQIVLYWNSLIGVM